MLLLEKEFLFKVNLKGLICIYENINVLKLFLEVQNRFKFLFPHTL